MRMFVINNGRQKTSIMEVECEKITALEDPSVMWLLPSDSKYRILAPTSFHEKKETGSAPPVWYSHSFYERLEEAKSVVEKNIRYTMTEFAKAKHQSVATEEEVQKAISEVEVIFML